MAQRWSHHGPRFENGVRVPAPVLQCPRRPHALLRVPGAAQGSMSLGFHAVWHIPHSRIPAARSLTETGPRSPHRSPLKP